MQKKASLYTLIAVSIGLIVFAGLGVGLLRSRSVPVASADQLDQPLYAVPPDFTDTVVTNVGSPTALAFTPDGRILITTQGGTVRIFQNGALLGTAALNITSRVCSDFERGLLGVAVDPNFASNNRIYLYYTFNKFNSCARNASNSPVNRASRFILGANNVIDPASEVVLVDNIASPNGNHNAGDVQFGRDGFLYISAGDGGCQLTNTTACAGQNQNARRMDILSGKILRVDTNGLPPSSNPWVSMAGSRRCGDPAGVPGGTGPCRETFAWGLRNPFRIAFDPNASGTRFFINDVGQNAWEEIDLAQIGADYGWNVREGNCVTGSTTNCGAPPAGMTNPIHAYGRTSGCASITGGAFVPNGVWPSTYTGAYLFSDFVCGRIFTLTPNGSGGFNVADFATGLGNSSAVHLTFGPNGSGQALYYTTFAGGGQIRRIAFVGTGNRPPTAAVTASPTSGATPLTVNFNGSGSSDPDGNPLTYVWNFGDGSPVRETTAPTTSFTYSTPGSFTAQLTVRDSLGATSAPATIRIDAGNTPPVPQIISPSPTMLFRVGQTITLQGSAADAQDGTLPASRLSWRVILHHNDHVHPFVPATTGNNITFTTPAPEDLAATENSFLEIELTATDTAGAQTVITQNLQPNRINITFQTAPAGLNVVVNGTPLTGPRTIVSWESYVLNVSAPNQNDGAGNPMVFGSWSDGGAASHAITTPATATTYTATFVPGSVTNTPTPTPTQPAGSQVIQAENASFGGGATADSNNAGFMGTGFINFNASGGFVQFNNVNGGSGGNATLRIRYALGASASRTGQLTVNGAAQNITFATTGAWTTWALQNVTVPLNAGTTNTIRFQSTGQDLANIDQIEVVLGATVTSTPTSTPTRTPTPVGPTPTPTATQTTGGLWAHYPFDGNANDASGSGRNGTLVNGPTFVAGRIGQAVNLAGGAGGSASQHVSLPGGILNGLTNFTIAAWVRLDTSGSWRRIFDFGTGTTVNMFLVPSSGSNVRFAITTGGSGAEQRINGSPVLPTGVWKHVAVTRSGNTATLYVDGVQVGQNTSMTLSPSSLGSTNQNWIGRSQYPADPFLDGQIDEFRIYSRALTAAEVLALFQNP